MSNRGDRPQRHQLARWPTITAFSLALLSGVSCVPSLTSVKKTAQIGTQLSTYDDAFDLAVTYCHVADSSPDDKNCSDLEADLKNWHAVNRALVGYASALNAMADDSKDTNEKDNVSTALGAVAKVDPASLNKLLGTNVINGVSQGVSALVSGIVGVYRRERLASIIKTSDDSLAATALGLSKNIDLLDGAEDNVIKAITRTISSIQKGSSEAAAKEGHTLALRALIAQIGVHRIVLANYKRAIAAFTNAHHQVREGLKHFGEKSADLELAKLITSDTISIISGVKTATTAPKPTNP